MQKVWRAVTRAKDRERRDAIKAEKGKPGKPIDAQRHVSVAQSNFKLCLLRARRSGAFSDIVLQGIPLLPSTSLGSLAAASNLIQCHLRVHVLSDF